MYTRPQLWWLLLVTQFKEMNELKLKWWTCRAVSEEGFNSGGEPFQIEVGGSRREKICHMLITAVAIYLDSYMHLCIKSHKDKWGR